MSNPDMKVEKKADLLSHLGNMPDGLGRMPLMDRKLSTFKLPKLKLGKGMKFPKLAFPKLKMGPEWPKIDLGNIGKWGELTQFQQQGKREKKATGPQRTD